MRKFKIHSSFTLGYIGLFRIQYIDNRRITLVDHTNIVLVISGYFAGSCSGRTVWIISDKVHIARLRVVDFRTSVVQRQCPGSNIAYLKFTVLRSGDSRQVSTRVKHKYPYFIVLHPLIAACRRTGCKRIGSAA